MDDFLGGHYIPKLIQEQENYLNWSIAIQKNSFKKKTKHRQQQREEKKQNKTGPDGFNAELAFFKKKPISIKSV